MTTTGPMILDDDLDHREEELNRELQFQAQEDSIAADKRKLERSWRGNRVLIAAEKGRLLELVLHIQQDESILNFADSDGYTPLHRASYGGFKDVVKYLIKHGADIEARTTDDWRPLHCAVRWNNIEVADYLIQQGADINAKSSGGNTPLHIVASNGRYAITCDIIQLILFHPNCDYMAKNNAGDTAYDIAKRSGPFYKFWVGVMTLTTDLEVGDKLDES